MVERVKFHEKYDGQPRDIISNHSCGQFSRGKVQTCNRFNYVIFHIHSNNGVIFENL